jgi:hypothetical protein
VSEIGHGDLRPQTDFPDQAPQSRSTRGSELELNTLVSRHVSNLAGSLDRDAGHLQSHFALLVQWLPLLNRLTSMTNTKVDDKATQLAELSELELQVRNFLETVISELPPSHSLLCVVVALSVK